MFHPRVSFRFRRACSRAPLLLAAVAAGLSGESPSAHRHVKKIDICLETHLHKDFITFLEFVKDHVARPPGPELRFIMQNRLSNIFKNSLSFLSCFTLLIS